MFGVLYIMWPPCRHLVVHLREVRLRWYGHIIRRDEGELVRDME
jgi:hypothetical protein